MLNPLIEPVMPEKLTGLNSLRYNGTIVEFMPVAIPTTNLCIQNMGKFVNWERADPSMPNISQKINASLRLTRESKNGVKTHPIKAPKAINALIKPFQKLC